MKTYVTEVVAGLRKVVGGQPPVIGSRDPFKVLIATILSARTRDENTAKVAAELFKVYKTPREIADAPIRRLESLVRSSGFYKVKARRIKEVSRQIVEEFSGKVPDSIDELCSLKGVGRKTANCVLVYAFKTPAIPVDTHVHRMSNRLGWVFTKTPEETERELAKIMPKKYWIELNNLMVKYGRIMCLPRRPKCGECVIAKYCGRVGADST
ncbi:MAG: endonuclease III [Candidatus Altiarchaeota archaeon]